MIPYFGASVYDDPEVYARSSPINFIKKVKTPTLVLVGEHDLECPAPQSFEFWRALQRLGVPTQLVVYEGEGHGIQQPKHKRDILRRSALWLHRALRPSLPPMWSPSRDPASFASHRERGVGAGGGADNLGTVHGSVFAEVCLFTKIAPRCSRSAWIQGVLNDG